MVTGAFLDPVAAGCCGKLGGICPPCTRCSGAWKDTASPGQPQVKCHRLLILSVIEDHRLAHSRELCFPKLVPETRTMTAEYGSGHGAIREFDAFLFSAVQNAGFPWEITTLGNLSSVPKETVWSGFWWDFHFSVKSSNIFFIMRKKDALCVCWNNCIIPDNSLETGIFVTSVLIYLSQYHVGWLNYFVLAFIDLVHLFLLCLVRLMLKTTVIVLIFLT